MTYYVFVLLALSRFHDVSTLHLKTRWNIEQSYTKDIEEIEIVYSSGKDSDNWIKEEPDYYPEKEIREYLEAHPYIVQNYLFETSLRTVFNDDDDYEVCPIDRKPLNYTKLPDIQFGEPRYIVNIPNLVPVPEINYCNTNTSIYPEKRNCSDLMKPGYEASCEMMNQTVQLLAGSLDKNMNKFTVQTYDFNIPYYCTCMLVPTP